MTRLKDVRIQTNTERLVILLRQLHISQQDLAKQLGYHPVYVESIINGRKPFNRSFEKRLNENLKNRGE
ncbi:helix-turn-helix domain-containing protein [Jeotgalibacillus proteolyticus]|uniref:helix-turn-helix domain-containing protein n=1 Tax=Jeotgalibacillus proteolyticus TaxID=2082395 RepID=UPI003CFA78E8